MPRMSPSEVSSKVIAVFQNAPQQTILIGTKFLSDWTYCRALLDMLPLRVCMPWFLFTAEAGGYGNHQGIPDVIGAGVVAGTSPDVGLQRRS
ncbi:hypothetical protein ARTHRO9AX_100108 [Arthrobacter sp. 9AX]|nr:hypothetical protein ARTHRO9AX_100108 [Arthrobacter sp. 9AX]